VRGCGRKTTEEKFCGKKTTAKFFCGFSATVWFENNSNRILLYFYHKFIGDDSPPSSGR